MQMHPTYAKSSCFNDAMLYVHSDVSTVGVSAIVWVRTCGRRGGLTGFGCGVWCGVVGRCLIVCGVGV